ncbi:hypothetical protein BHE74_00002381 [Ensete ventricosum]|uniref:Uncharacterized protein n=1 Tax=Ensete ventricosum TaxID=4639 RepID=A0A444FYQ6_ENSVE|nr:hypothetical protein B296_00007776 [Ensete ventricosum]RWW27743.1 hypothetical protein GW17_00007819 [Ensete ventricosum]RWW88732.1 hypothetical protein BHE74_00002381 [Ensete ventricosum]RZR81937.1 hypothetical protein BHM03_00008247 [Ensete ventricosum]
MAVEGQRDPKNAALISSVRTLMNSKVGMISIGGSASSELYRGFSLQVAAQRLLKGFIYS